MVVSTDYSVSEETQKLWQIELAITDVLLDFCRKNNLRIFACYGTLLGAARHKGFIPWDDDVDFVMMREDYDNLLNLIDAGIDSLPDGYEFDNNDITVTRLRRNDTTMINSSYRWSKDIKQGIWVDINCLDVAPDDFDSVKGRYDVLNKRMRMYQNYRLGFYAQQPKVRYMIRHFVIKLFFCFRNIKHFRKITEDMLREDAKTYSGKTVWGFMLVTIIRANNKIALLDTSWFEDTVLLPFENRLLPCPKGWDQLLTAVYGEWRIPIKGSSLHEGVHVNIDMSYKDYIEHVLKSMPWWKRYLYTH